METLFTPSPATARKPWLQTKGERGESQTPTMAAAAAKRHAGIETFQLIEQ